MNRCENLRYVDRYDRCYWLNYYMSCYAERAISMSYITLVMSVRDRQSAAKDN